MGGARKKQPTPPPSQNIVNCLFSKRQVKVERNPDDDEPHHKEPPGGEHEPAPIQEETQEAEEPREASLGP